MLDQAEDCGVAQGGFVEGLEEVYTCILISWMLPGRNFTTKSTYRGESAEAPDLFSARRACCLPE
jgi:hypothetical protein